LFNMQSNTDRIVLTLAPRTNEEVDDVDLEANEGVVDLGREADEEARRLLYVGLTRARDLLIQAFPEKAPDGGLLESLGPGSATLLTPAVQGTTSLTLPSG